MEYFKDKLAQVKAQIQRQTVIKSDTVLNVGDIVKQRMDRNDGLALKNEYKDRRKFFVIVGKNSKGDAIGLCLINSDLDFYKNTPAMQPFQYILKYDNYKTVLEKDSRLDCAKLFPMKTRKSVAVKAELVGHLIPEDEANVLKLVADCGFINAHMKKVYRIGQI
jgi:hypothetical protein